MTWLGPDDVIEPDCRHMDADAELLMAVEQGAGPAMRCYRWSKPAVTIGRFQSQAAAEGQYRPLPIYRRPTGGLAVVHGDDLTLCVATHTGARRGAPGERVSVLDVYRFLLDPLRATLDDFGKRASFGDDLGSISRTITSEDCFAGIAACDLIDSKRGIKIIGSALRRTARAVLLQASLRPLPELNIHSCEFVERLRCRYERCLNGGCCNIAEG